MHDSEDAQRLRVRQTRDGVALVARHGEKQDIRIANSLAAMAQLRHICSREARCDDRILNQIGMATAILRDVPPDVSDIAPCRRRNEWQSQAG